MQLLWVYKSLAGQGILCSQLYIVEHWIFLNYSLSMFGYYVYPKYYLTSGQPHVWRNTVFWCPNVIQGGSSSRQYTQSTSN